MTICWRSPFFIGSISALGPHLDAAAAGDVGLVDAAPADDQAAGREVGAGDQPDQLAQLLFAGERRRVGRRHQRLLDHPDDAVDDLPQVVRRDVGGHADGDAGRAVDQQVRVDGGEDRRFGGRLVEVGDEVDGVLVEVVHHRFGDGLEPGLGVAIGGRPIAVDRAEVALAVDQGGAHVEVLGEADQGVVGRGVAVRVVVADDLADDLGALAVGAVAGQAHLPHREQDAAVRRLEPVAHVGQRPPDDHAHRVIQVRALHLVFDVDGYACLVGHACSGCWRRLRRRLP